MASAPQTKERGGVNYRPEGRVRNIQALSSEGGEDSSPLEQSALSALHVLNGSRETMSSRDGDCCGVGRIDDTIHLDPSCWSTDGGTPMTSRPHFRSLSSGNLEEIEEVGPYPMKRTRSRSLGSSPRVQKPLNKAQGPKYDPIGEQKMNGVFSSSIWQNLWTPTDQVITIPKYIKPRSIVNEDVNSMITQNEPVPQEERHRNESSNGHSNFFLTRNSNQNNQEGNPFWVSVLYGLINATIVLPVLMSFASIIYRDQEFAPYMPILIKLTTISGVVHQLCFSAFSSLPFAVGQVQDAGLIFLSSMASFIVHYCKDRGLNEEVLLATTTVILSLGTAVLGLGLLLIGQGGLAQYVQMLPTSVVGGYLAFIGWFCGMAGIGLMAGQSSVSFKEITEDGSWPFVIPGIFGGIIIYVAVRQLKHVAVLPSCMIALLLLFYLVLWITNSSVQQVSEQGWIRAIQEQPHWTRTWDYLRLDLVEWAVLPHLILTELSMICVVAISSSLDVAAIELELKRPLNYNSELKMVGISNFLSGLTGGYTGSYIFSQSIFNLRAGVKSRAAGYVLATAELLFFLIPFPILAYIPNFFFGSLLSMICVDLVYEWLWDVRRKVTAVEYLICLGTFAAIQIFGVELGILLGFVAYHACRWIGLNVTEPRTVYEDGQKTENERARLVDGDVQNIDSTDAENNIYETF